LDPRNNGAPSKLASWVAKRSKKLVRDGSIRVCNNLTLVNVKAKPYPVTNIDNLLNVSGHLVLMTTQRKIVKESKNQLRLK